MNLLANKVAIITGAGRGIGRAIALKYAQEGASVAITDLKIDESVEAFIKELEALGVKAKAYASNAANFDDAHKLVDEVVADFGRIDVLVNNAGITRDGLMMRMSEEQWDLVINVNLKSAFNLIHAVTPVMVKQRSGSIINMASVVGVSGNAGLFGSAGELAKVCQLLLQHGAWGEKQVIPTATVRLFTETNGAGGIRALGFDKPRSTGGPTGIYASSRTYGHLGFTGTCFWVDPEYDLVFVFLSNRTYPSRQNTTLIRERLRQRLQDLVYEAIGATTPR